MRRAGESFGLGICYGCPAQIYQESGGRRNRCRRAGTGGGEKQREKRNRTLSISGDVVEKMRLYAELDARPLSQYVNLVLKRHLAEIEEQESMHKKRA